jgi:hypothetical protein
VPLQLNIDIDASNQIVQNCRAVRGEGQEENNLRSLDVEGYRPVPTNPYGMRKRSHLFVVSASALKHSLQAYQTANVAMLILVVVALLRLHYRSD